MLTSAREQYRQQQRISALGLREARRQATRGAASVAAVVATYQAESAGLTFGSTAAVIAEQGIVAPAVATASLSSLVTAPNVTAELLAKAATEAAFDTLVLALMQDAGRTAATVDVGRRPALTGYVRSLLPPSCSRCAILAGRVYRYSTGFERHPRCDCLMTPTTQAIGPSLVTDPTEAVERGWVRGLSKGDLEALEAGADLNQLVNVRRRKAGLTVGSSVYTRGGRLTPQAIMRTAESRAQVVDLLRANRYIT